jgi:ADP-heptose:LPS heptosyltransferase
VHVAKPLEPLLRRLALATQRPRGNRLAAPLDPSCIRRAMLYRPQRFGDLLATLPILRALRASFPGWHLSLWTSAQGRELMEPEGLVDELIELSGRPQDRLLKASAGKFDLVLDLVAHDSVNALRACARAAGSGVLAGFGKQRYASYYDWARAYPSADRYAPYGGLEVLKLFGEGVEPGAFGPAFTDSEQAWAAAQVETAGRAAVVNLSARHRWPEASWSALLDFLRDRGLTPVFVNAIDRDRAIGARLAQRHGHEVRLVPDGASFRQVACLVSRAGLLVSPDTSLVHVAGPAGVPTVALFTRRHDFRLSWIPEGDHVRALQAIVPETLEVIPPASVGKAVESLTGPGTWRSGG